MGGQNYAPAALLLEMRALPILQEAGGGGGHGARLEVCGKTSRPVGSDSRIVHPVASRYINYTISTHHYCLYFILLLWRIYYLQIHNIYFVFCGHNLNISLRFRVCNFCFTNHFVHSMRSQTVRPFSGKGFTYLCLMI
jgi:hypothetical protein